MEKKYSYIGKRLKDLRGSLSQSEMANRFNMPLRSYQYYESGERVPPMPILAEIATQYGKTVDWLLSGDLKLPATYTEGAELHIDEHPDLEANIETDFTYVPQVNGKISAGKGSLPDNVIEMKVAFRKEWIARKGNAKDMVLIKVSGDSMAPTLLSGDLVLIDRGRKYFEPQGGIYAIALEDAIMIKRVQLVGDRVKIISDNKMYEPFEVMTDQVKINGKVIWFARELER
ncbi:MAG: XRE family transcriptional regulator [Syntrophorhabdaceae bacterium]